MNQTRKTLALLTLAAFTLTLNVACSHSAKKDDTVHIDSGSAKNAGGVGFVETAQAGETGQTLFQRLGGMKVLTDFSNKFVEAMSKTPQITANPKVAAAFKKDQSRFKDQLAIQLCEVSDGPCKYKGKNMKDAHAGMAITPDQWRAMGKIFIKVLRDVGVQKNERVELANRVSRFKPDVVTAANGPAMAAAPATKSEKVVVPSSVDVPGSIAPSAAPSGDSNSDLPPIDNP